VAASITHLVVGERVLNQYYSDSPPEVQGAFLAGCALVDVHAFNDIDRRYTHFTGTVEEDGEKAYLQSCANFLHSLDTLLRSPWNELQPSERSFASGYLCHLAVDECWKKLGSQLFQKFDISSWADFPVPGDVSLTTFDFMCKDQLLDPHALDAKLEHITIPDVFVHVPVTIFTRQWNIIQEYVSARGTSEAHFLMLERAGRSKQEIEETRQRYQTYWERGIELVQSIGGVDPFLQDGIKRSMQVIPQLLVRASALNLIEI
jgi:hypothetical protein